MVTVLFLGRLEDVAGGPERSVAAGRYSDLLAGLEADLAGAVTDPRIRIALNGVLVNDAAALVLADGDELAFLPPVSGG